MHSDLKTKKMLKLRSDYEGVLPSQTSLMILMCKLAKWQSAIHGSVQT